MIALRRHQERRHVKLSTHESWFTFYGQDAADPLAGGFDALEFLDEYSLSPAARVPRRAPGDTESITYVREGSLTLEDSTGVTSVMQAGEFQSTTVGRSVRYAEANPSLSAWVHVVRASVRASRAGLSPAREQRRFSVAERRGGLCVVASPDARGGSLRLRQDTLVHSALLQRGQHVAYVLRPDRSAWLHILSGGVALGGVALTAGDGAGMRGEPVVSFTATKETELLLLDTVRLRGGT